MSERALAASGNEELDGATVESVEGHLETKVLDDSLWLGHCDLEDPETTLEACGWPTTRGAVQAAYTASGASLLSSDARVATPFLPWPPPAPAYFVRLDKQISATGKFASIARKIEAKLTDRGYDQLLYFGAEGGFALATEIERFEPDGRPAASGRFISKKLGGWFSLQDYFRKLVMGERGHFRLFVFVVTATPFTPAPYEIIQSDLDRWKRTGVFALPNEIASSSAPTSTKAYLLIYELQTTPGRSESLAPSQEPLRRSLHLKWLGL